MILDVPEKDPKTPEAKWIGGPTVKWQLNHEGKWKIEPKPQKIITWGGGKWKKGLEIDETTEFVDLFAAFVAHRKKIPPKPEGGPERGVENVPESRPTGKWRDTETKISPILIAPPKRPSPSQPLEIRGCRGKWGNVHGRRTGSRGNNGAQRQKAVLETGKRKKEVLVHPEL